MTTPAKHRFQGWHSLPHFTAAACLLEPLQALPREDLPLLSSRFSAVSCSEDSFQGPLSWPRGLSFPSSPRGGKRLTPAPPSTELIMICPTSGFGGSALPQDSQHVFRQSGSDPAPLSPIPPVYAVHPRSPPGGHLRSPSHIWFQCLCQMSLSSPSHFPSPSTWSPGQLALSPHPHCTTVPRLPSTNGPTESPAPLLIRYETV